MVDCYTFLIYLHDQWQSGLRQNDLLKLGGKVNYVAESNSN